MSGIKGGGGKMIGDWSVASGALNVSPVQIRGRTGAVGWPRPFREPLPRRLHGTEAMSIAVHFLAELLSSFKAVNDVTLSYFLQYYTRA